MTSDPTLGRRVSRLENDTESIDELITDVRSTLDDHTRRLDSIDTTLTEHTRRLDTIDTTLTKHDGRFDSIDTTLAEIVRRLPDPDQRA